ncbi:MAG: pirin family protein [Steroidobacteraceae bacterium]|jgi:redox-sensitive bicupin YhaK (pirin superfamily)
MSIVKTVKQIHPATRDDIGDLTTRRPLPGPTLDRLGAFLFLNHHGPQTYAPGNQGLPFGPHPHRGFETVTLILEGELAHLDSAGHESIIRAGGVQWMTAGSGLVHAEISPHSFKQRGGPLEILQLWVNLPARLKMTSPRYVGLQRDAIPTLVEDDGRAVVNLISGSRNGTEGPIRSLTGVFMSTLQLRAGGRIQFDGLRGRDVFLYVVRGEVDIAGQQIAGFRLVELGEGDSVVIESRTDAYILFGHADPINEAVVSQGPFVMNSEDEIRQAYAEFRAGKFGIPVH